ncbi:MAG: DNA repair protein RadA [Proteobacteria bacterium]|nr:DNA repair protein RadA [Pseudomonadota bacterium]MBU4012523.1 DNA repair protein RadA [Pseudomonadota bacterium]MBU4068359.1 DNA repair protein RadA [Pseudomonadota bacterium]MBU4102161.1 DNA repair protein RadA [Pseudomonadota bacterium]MBU4127033.1 DNA repair protein RadA [Pseudomonadota bacterium]
MKKNSKTIFCCQKCGYQTPKWMGKCPDCGQWQTFVEEIQTLKPDQGPRRKAFSLQSKPVPIDSIKLEDEYRLLTGINEFDRVLGGGLVPGTLVLIGGAPGIGKSTLMLQALHGLANMGHKVLYVSGEESTKQISIRSKRLSTVSHDLLVVSEIDVEAIQTMLESTKPDVLVIDSIQTMFNSDLTSAPGSVSQVRESAIQLMFMAKNTSIPIFLVGHVTKDGAIAGPRLLEHMVDTVLYFEGDRNHVFRILRAVKNRFGSTNEIGVFEMNELGLQEVANPSAVFLSERPVNTPGSVVTASMEGTRPILVELQALASRTNFGTPRRTVLGIDQNRVALLVAVMEKKLGMDLMGHDIFMNVAGGIKVDEPAIDMGIVSAIASSFLDKPISDATLVLGEVGLTGEVRAVSHIETRVNETKKMGFSRCLVPESNLKRMTKVEGIDVIGVKTVAEAIEILF